MATVNTCICAPNPNPWISVPVCMGASVYGGKSASQGAEKVHSSETSYERGTYQRPEMRAPLSKHTLSHTNTPSHTQTDPHTPKQPLTNIELTLAHTEETPKRRLTDTRRPLRDTPKEQANKPYHTKTRLTLTKQSHRPSHKLM